jgi:tetratricopeptide (TPR) repeat protein
MKFAALLAFVFSTSAFAQHHEAHAAGEIRDLGHLVFESSGAPAAQPHLIRGLLLLHSFEYGQAAEAFRDAQEADPSFAMAYWGEAMTYNHTIWGEQDLAAARAVLARLGKSDEERLAKAPTAREKAYLHAIHALYGTGTKKERDAAYEAAMGKLAAAYPNDLDARAFHALSLLGLNGIDRDTANYMRAASVAEEVYELNPRHPGALHYLIHAYDDPLHAPLGLRAARKYGKVAPAASHALHMPSHIFFALGMWDASIEANVASLESARRGGAIGSHPMHWLVYAYLQQGRRDDAAGLLKMLAGDLEKRSSSAPARVAQAQICATWIVETGNDEEVPCKGDIDRKGIKSIDAFTGYELARGLLFVRRNDLPAARNALKRLESLREEGRALVGAADAASRMDQVTESEIAFANVMIGELRAAILFAEGKREEALKTAAEAAAAEDRLTFEYGPPRAPKPPAELYADLLAKAGRAAEARVQYERTLQRTPGRALALAPLRTAAERVGSGQ